MPVGEGDPEAIQFKKLRGEFLIIEEKVDGSHVSIGMDSRFDIQIMHRGSPAISKEYRELNRWADHNWEDLLSLLGERYILFGEWMQNKHSIYYDKLPHYFLESDIYDQTREVWLSTNARNDLLKKHPYIKRVPVISAFKPSELWQITNLVGKSNYQSDNWQGKLKQKCHMLGFSAKKVLQETDNSGLMEGLYIKHEDDFQVLNRYKYVRYDFLKTILDSGSHLIDRQPITNELENMGE